MLAKYDKSNAAYLASGKSRTGNSYKAASYVNNVSWVDKSQTNRLDKALSDAATRSLNEVSDGRAGTVESIDVYLADSIAACGLTDKLDASKQKATSTDNLADRLKTKAASRPWYPRGYHEVVDGVALKWFSGHVDCYDCSYWTAYVVSRDGCPSGLYVEMGIEDGGTAVGWTNDSLSYLRPGQRGRMEFVNYGTYNRSLQGSVSEVNCY